MRRIVQMYRRVCVGRRVYYSILFCMLVFCLLLLFPCSAQALWPVAARQEVCLGFHEGYSIGDINFSHYGVDLTAPAGCSVRAAVGGTVSFVGAVPVTGRFEGQTMQAVSVTMADGRIMTFMPFAEFDVSTGDDVAEGDALGALASSGDSSCNEVHLHVGLKRGKTYYDPLELFGDNFSTNSQNADEFNGVAVAAGGVVAGSVPEYAGAIEESTSDFAPSAGLGAGVSGVLPQATPKTTEEEQGSRVSSGGVTLGAPEGEAAGTSGDIEYGGTWLDGLSLQGAQACFVALVAKAQQCFGQVQGLLGDMGGSLSAFAVCLLVLAFGLTCAGLLFLLKRIGQRIATLHPWMHIKQLKPLVAHKWGGKPAHSDAMHARHCSLRTTEAREQKPILKALKGLKVLIGKGKVRHAF